MLKQQFANVRVDPTAAGASGDVLGIFEPEPICMLMVVAFCSMMMRDDAR
jgi:hypothetical protein